MLPFLLLLTCDTDASGDLYLMSVTGELKDRSGCTRPSPLFGVCCIDGKFIASTADPVLLYLCPLFPPLHLMHSPDLVLTTSLVEEQSATPFSRPSPLLTSRRGTRHH